jgi:AraC-like DNA-binding protein
MTRTQYATRDVDAAHAFLGARYVGHRVVAQGRSDNFRFAAEGGTAGKLDLAHTRHSVRTTVSTEPFHILLFVTVSRGIFEVTAGREHVRLTRGGVLLYPIGTPLTAAWDCFDIHLLNLPFDAVAEAAAPSGITPEDLRFEAMTPVSPAMTCFWRSTVGLVDRELAAPDSALAHPLVQASSISMLAAAALSVFPNTAMTAAQRPGPGRVEPAALRRAVAFIDAHADQPIALSDIAEAAGVGARALRHAFTREHETTPLGYLRTVRLERAHRDLQAADPTRGGTVAAIARRWGFTNPGRFATMYRRTYRHPPSQTLRT